jgi:hypothetical protein
MRVQANYNVSIADIIMTKDEIIDIIDPKAILSFKELINFIPAYCKKPYFDVLEEDVIVELNNSTVETINESEIILPNEDKPIIEDKLEDKSYVELKSMYELKI